MMEVPEPKLIFINDKPANGIITDFRSSRTLVGGYKTRCHQLVRRAQRNPPRVRPSARSRGWEG